MHPRRLCLGIATAFAILLLIGTPGARAQSGTDGARDADGLLLEARHRPQPASSPRRADVVRRWNRIAVDASGFDHAGPGEQPGPGRAARAMAIVHIAIFDAVNAMAGGYRSYTRLPRAHPDTSFAAAVAQAAHDALVELFPSQKASFDALLAEDLAKIPSWQRYRKARGIALGKRAAEAILAMRSHDGSHHKEPLLGIDYFPDDDPGVWRQDPISLLPVALGGEWDHVDPFVLRSADQYRVPPPPALDSPEYAAAFAEVQALGGDDDVTPSLRSDDQTEIGIYWAYDGTPTLCAPPRLYNQIAVHIADQKGTGAVQLARLLALVNVSMADAGMAIWESKYFYAFWRPVTGIRESDPGTGPTGDGDGNPDTLGDPTFSPLGAPASNTANRPNFTPPFPAYPSGHAGFGGALFETLRNFYGTDRIPFTFVSDELNGVTLDNQGNARPLRPRSFSRLSQAEEENGQSRIYLGIHWAFDKTEGIAQGRKVADAVFRKAFTRVR
jgi:PAP2 superfamily